MIYNICSEYFNSVMISKILSFRQNLDIKSKHTRIPKNNKFLLFFLVFFTFFTNALQTHHNIIPTNISDINITHRNLTRLQKGQKRLQTSQSTGHDHHSLLRQFNPLLNFRELMHKFFRKGLQLFLRVIHIQLWACDCLFQIVGGQFYSLGGPDFLVM